ncbi:restriction endonuclease subunit S, partial [Lentibacillus lipolyticus]
MVTAKLQQNEISNWIIKKLGDVSDIKIGGTPARKISSYWDTQFETNNYWVSIKDLNKKYISQTNERISDEGVNNSNVKLLPPNTVIMSFKLSIGNIGITSVPLYTNEAIAGFIPKDNYTFDEHFLYYAL